MIALLVAAIFVPVAFGLSFVVSRTVHRRKREASPQPKAPRDLDRPYPRPKGHRSRLNRVCPVCGAGKETAAMDARVLGWPAHGACADWLGDWEPGKIPSEDADGPQPDFAPGRPEGVTPPDAKPGQAGRCYCNWCQGRPGVHGAEAVALYRAQVSAAMAGPGPVAWEWHCRCGAEAEGTAADRATAETAGRDGLAAHRTRARCRQFAEWTLNWR